MGTLALLETNLGALFLGIFVNTYLYGIVTHQYFSYFTTKFGDALWIKGVVFALFALDTVHTSSLIYMAWYYLIENYANYLALLNPLWPYPLTVVVTACTAFLTHILLTYRILRLTNVYVYGVLLLCSMGSFGGGLACGIKSWITVRSQLKYSPSATIIGDLSPLLAGWLCSEVIVDASISATLIYALSKSRTGFHNSEAIINRLMRTSIQTGLFSGAFSIFALGFYLARPDTEFFALFGIPISRLYTNTLMDTLLCREQLRGLLNKNESRSIGNNTNRSIQMSVQKEVRTDVKFDEPPLLSPTSKSFKAASKVYAVESQSSATSFQ